MPNINTVEAIGDKLAATTIDIDPKRCSFVRNKNVTCRRCRAICPHDAITLETGIIHIDSELCTNCGACVGICPTGALLTTAPDAGDIVSEARESAEVNDGTVCFACSAAAEKLGLDLSRVVVLPCLDYLDEYLMLGLFATGTKRVALIRDDCEECAVGSASPFVEKLLANLEKLQAEWNFEVKVIEPHTIPDSLKGEGSRPPIGSHRRKALARGGSSAIDFAADMVGDVVGSLFEPQRQRNAIERVVVRPEERFEPNTYRSLRMLNALRHLAEPADDAITHSRFWARVEVDTDFCVECGACAKYCPTRALRFIDESEEGEGEKLQQPQLGSLKPKRETDASLFFRPTLCCNCMTCRDICMGHAIKMTHDVLIKSLLDDELLCLYHKEASQKKPSASSGNPFLS